MNFKKIIGNVKSVFASKKRQPLVLEGVELAGEHMVGSDFMSRVSHEIRTPMNVILGMTEIAKNTSDMEKIRYCLDTIEMSAAQMLELINNVLDIESGELELNLTPFSIEKVLAKAYHFVSDKTEQKHQRFNINHNKNITRKYIGDELKISQIITNLLTNAVKFTPRDGKITLDVEEIQKENGYSVLRFTVTDTGIGISEEQLTKLFQPFGHISSQFGKTGFGLAVSKNLSDKMGGKLWAESELNSGSKFYFQIRLEHPALSDENETPDLSRFTMLLAEDIEVNQEIVLALLHDTGIRIDVVGSGLAVVHKFTAEPDKYDIIFMDIQMPEMDGYEATRAIRSLSEPKAKFIPIIAMTANAFREDREKAIQSGMNDHLPKPINRSILIGKIMQYVATK